MSNATRTRILDYLRKNPSASADELGRSLQMTGANVRHHLEILMKEGQIIALNRQKGTRGRPVGLYGLSNQALGSGIQKLLESMLETWVKTAPPEVREALLHSLAQSLGGINPREPAANPSRRLGQTVDRLNDLHYQARWEAGAKGARVILGHCPYSEIIERHPELCRLDSFLLEARIGLPVRQRAKLEPGKDGIRRCIFQIE